MQSLAACANRYQGDQTMKKLLALLCATVLVACGGGGSGTNSAVTPPPQPAPSTLALFAGDLASWGNLDEVGSAARFSYANGIATDNAGYVYVTEAFSSTIRKISPDGAVSTLAGKYGVNGSADGMGADASFGSLSGIVTDSTGNVYVTDQSNHTIRKITPNGVVSTVAGAPGISGSSDGLGNAARFNRPAGIATDALGNLYVADTDNNTIRKITPTGVVSTIAGAAGWAGKDDGIGAAARFAGPRGIIADRAGNFYVASETGCTYMCSYSIRKITQTGVVSTVVEGTGALGYIGRLSLVGLATDSAGNLFIGTGNNLIRKLAPDGAVSTFAGGSTTAGSADGIGLTARFSGAHGLATDSADNIYVADEFSVRKVAPTGRVTTLAGAVPAYQGLECSVSATQFQSPYGVATDTQGNVYVADTFNHAVRKVSAEGVISTLAGIPSLCQLGHTDSKDLFYTPTGIATDSAGNVFVADSTHIRKITPDRVVSTLAGAVGVSGSADGPGASARFGNPDGIATDRAGNLYVADSDNLTIRKITPDGIVSTLAGKTGYRQSLDGTGSAANFFHPQGLTTDSAGNIYVTDSGHCGPCSTSRWSSIRKITPSGVVSTLAGAYGTSGNADGLGSAARFGTTFSAGSLATDRAGNIYVADTDNHSIRKITPAGLVSTVVGRNGRAGFAAGPLPGSLYKPRGIAIYDTTMYITMANGVAVVTNLP